MHKLLVAATGLVVSTAGAGTVYVDDDAPPGGDGSSWNTAYQSLQQALMSALVGSEIRVAQGVYQPDGPTASFVLKIGVTLRGGYAGLLEPDPDLRDVEQFESVLSGDLPGTDAYHVVRGSGVYDCALDGFTITGGQAYGSCCVDDRGGGMYLSFSTFPVIACTFKDNTASNDGGAVWLDHSNPTFTDCSFEDNFVAPGNAGGAIHDVFFSHLTLIRCYFRHNTLGASSTGGGVVFVGGNILGHPASTITAIDCVFIDNNASSGGAVLNNGYGTFINCLFVGNLALGAGFGSKTGHGGAIANIGQTTITNCTFFGNSAQASGGGVWTGRDSNNSNLDSLTVVANSVLWGNTSSGVGGEAAQVDATNSTLQIDYSCVEGLTGSLGGTGNIGGDPLLVDPAADDFRLQAGSPCIDAGDNTAVPVDVTTDLDGNPRFLEVPETPDTGNGILPIVDMGAYESLGGGCLAVTGQEVVCDPDGTTFTVNVEGLNACTGGTTQATFTGSGGAAGEQMCFTVVVDDGGFCCSTEICVTIPDCAPVPAQSDLDGDGVVGIEDFLALLAAWGDCADCGACPADLDGDCSVGITDLLILLANWS